MTVVVKKMVFNGIIWCHCLDYAQLGYRIVGKEMKRQIICVVKRACLEHMNNSEGCWVPSGSLTITGLLIYLKQNNRIQLTQPNLTHHSMVDKGIHLYLFPFIQEQAAATGHNDHKSFSLKHVDYSMWSVASLKRQRSYIAHI